jgi:hypothetical protein
MSTKHERREARLLQDQRRKLEEAVEQGRGVAASAETPGRPGIHQTVFVRKTRDEKVSVEVEHYYPNAWDHTLDETAQFFATFAEALEWLESACGIRWTELHEPRPPSTS